MGDETLYKYGAAGKIWLLTEVNGAPFASRATIAFGEQGKVSGQAPCNRYFAKQTEPYPWFKLGPIGATKMACADLDHENIYFAALGRMTLAEVSETTLILSNDAEDLMVFRAE